MITAIHQIEITSRCNLRCKYCVHPKMSRAKLDMDFETFDHAVRLAAYFINEKRTQRELNLAGIGESTLHPDFIKYVKHAREVCGPRADLIIATNGLEISKNPGLAAALVPYRPRVWVSLHRPERAAPAVNALRSVGLLSGVSVDPSLAAIDWAGQVEWATTAPDIECPWLAAQRLFVTADGRVLSCCLDGRSESDGVVAADIRALDPRAAESLTVVPYSLCASCSYLQPQPAKEAA